MLGEIGAAGDKHTSDLRPCGAHGMSGGDEVEAAVGERQPMRVGFDDIDATRTEPVTGHGDVGR